MDYQKIKLNSSILVLNSDYNPINICNARRAIVLLIKDTSLISVLGVTAGTRDLARFGRDGVNHTANATPLIVAGLVYLAMTVPLTQLVAWMERREKAASR